MSFDYGYTCGSIDKAIESFNTIVKDYLLDLLSSIVHDGNAIDLATTYTAWIYQDVQDAFEDTRKENKDMRKEAENQIEELIRELEERDQHIGDLTEELSEANQHIEML